MAAAERGRATRAKEMSQASVPRANQYSRSGRREDKVEKVRAKSRMLEEKPDPRFLSS